MSVGRGLPGLLAASCLVLAGCGFHLRSYDLNTTVAAVHVTASGNNLASDPLRRGLSQAGVTLAELADEAELVVQLLDDRRDRRSVAVTDQARAAEYETSIGVRYAVEKPDGEVLIEPRWVDRVNIVGSSEEQVLLEREMVNDLVQQIIRALDAATRELEVAA